MCDACAFVRRQVGPGARCPFHLQEQRSAEVFADVAAGREAADHDDGEPWPPTALAPAPFTAHEYARLLILRSRVREGLVPRG